jgi:hypothetical protein
MNRGESCIWPFRRWSDYRAALLSPFTSAEAGPDTEGSQQPGGCVFATRLRFDRQEFQFFGELFGPFLDLRQETTIVRQLKATLHRSTHI